MRVYVPSTSTDLRALEASGGLPADLTAFAVTPGLREWYLDDDIEALEYAAMLDAARASLRLLDADTTAARRRVVLALDASDASVQVRDDLDRGVVRLITTTPLARIASVHVDDADAERAVTLAADSIIAADLGDEAAQDRVDDADGFELSWYATQEIGAALARL
ncbi:MAG: DUF6912 family protein [Jatrophihabitantaceae bacterium]